MNRILASLTLLSAVLIPGAAAAGHNKLTPAMCEMLGMAGEYISRFNYITGKPRPGHVESFDGGEAKLAAAYEKLIAAYNKESGARVTHTRVVGSAGQVNLVSDGLAKIINSFYVRHDKVIVTLDRKLILGASKACRLRYLKGAYARYNDDGYNAIRIANAPQKVETIGHVLKQLGARNVALFSFEAVPSSFMVFFEPAGAVAKALRVKKRVSRAEYQKAASNPTLDKQL
jgi:hypothetical protein